MPQVSASSRTSPRDSLTLQKAAQPEHLCSSMASAGVGAEVLRLDILFATIFYRCRRIKVKINYLNGRWRVDQGPAPQGPGRDEDPPGTPREPGDSQPGGDGSWQLLPGVPGQWRPLPPGADWMDEQDWEARPEAADWGEEPPDPDLELYLDPDHAI